MEVSDAKRLKALEDENAKLKKLLDRPDARSLGIARASVEKMLGPAAKREAVAHLQAVMGLSERRACSFVGADRKMIRYQSRRPPETELRGRLRPRERAPTLRLPAAVHPAQTRGRSIWGQPYLPSLSRGRLDGAQAPGKTASRRHVGAWSRQSRMRWSLDFVHDQFACGRRFRVLNIVDDVTRECLAAIPDTSISGRRVACELTELIAHRGKPGMIVSDHGTEFTSNAILAWSKDPRDRMALHRARQADADGCCRIAPSSHSAAFFTAFRLSGLVRHREVSAA